MRLHTYLILSITILSSIALPTILKQTFNKKNAQFIFLVLLFTTLSLQYWQKTKHVYAWYEAPDNYGRLLFEEKIALEWMENNLITGSHIISSQAARHSEWIKVFTRFPSTNINHNNPLYNLKDSELHDFAYNHNGTQLLVFKHVETIPEQMLQHPEWFPIIYETKAIAIISMPYN